MVYQNKLVSIGMPVYNGERFIREALDSLLAQSYQNFELIILDNASTDRTEEACREFEKKDQRVKYYKNERNLGGTYSLKRLLESAKGEYFMWAAHDDIWQPDFISACVNLLENNKNAGMAFSNAINIDLFGRVIRTYPSFEAFSGKNNIRNIINYLINSEKMGKANLVYSVYKLDICKQAWQATILNDEWGSDFCFVLAALSRCNLYIDSRILFKKRIVRDSDQADFASEIIVKNPQRHIFPLDESYNYIKNNLRAVKNTKYYYLVLIIMIGRLPRVFWNFLLNKLNGLKLRLKNQKHLKK
jgi:glycosyltransferase involved in cell wall biosynthesis